MGAFASASVRRCSTAAVTRSDCDATAARWHLPPSCLALLRAAYRVCQTSNIPPCWSRVQPSSTRQAQAMESGFPTRLRLAREQMANETFRTERGRESFERDQRAPIIFLLCAFVDRASGRKRCSHQRQRPRRQNTRNGVPHANMQPSAYTLYGVERERERERNSPCTRYSCI